MKVLITGFQPFGKETMNPSFEAVRLLPDEIMGAQIVKAEIPVVFHKGGEKVQELVRSEKPDIVILVGQAGGRTAMNPERVAINCEDCPTGGPDNEGNVPQGEKIYEDGPDAYFSKLPIKAMVKKMMDNGVPANIRGGFIHVPYATIQNHPNFASMTIEEISKGLKLSIEAAIENEKDIVSASGSTH